MKCNIYYYILLIGAAFTLGSCNDYEDVPLEKYTKDYLFSRTDSLGNKAKKYLTGIYNVMPNGHNRVDGDYLDAATDDAVTSALTDNQIYQLSVGRFGPSIIVKDDMYWKNLYTGIYKANTFITNIDVVPLKFVFDNYIDTYIPMNRAWKAEARFLRAFFYFELVKRYGGVPLIGDVPLELNQNIEFPRNTFEECIDYIVGELDVIKDSLRSVPIANDNSDGHVVTSGAAMALKSRVLLYAASPLFNGQVLEANNPLIGYTDYKAERWKKAADAAEWFMKLWGHTGDESYGLMSDYREIFLNFWAFGNGKNELIYFRQGGRDKSIEATNGPIGFTGDALGRGRTSPSQNLVNAFPMKDGKPIGDRNSKYEYKIAEMYNNRDPRLERTVLRNGSKWLGGTVDTYLGGKDNPTGSTLQKTKTGYYMSKFMGVYDDDSKLKYEDVRHLWVMFRYAEILLNYAEAQNEYELALNASAKPSAAIFDMVKMLRKRAGIEQGDDGFYGLDKEMTCLEMRDIIRNERRIEFAFEEHRYWDIRRWRIAEDVFEKPINGVVIVKNGPVWEIDDEAEVLKAPFEERRYFYPIPYSEVVKNDNMRQNPGW